MTDFEQETDDLKQLEIYLNKTLKRIQGTLEDKKTC